MKPSTLFLPALLAAGTGLSGRAAVPAPAPVQLHLSVQGQVVTRDAQGHARVAWRPVPVTGARPGDVLRYTLAGENRARLPVRGLALTQPVPAGTTFVAHSATGDAQVTYSVDNGHTFDAAPVVRVAAPGGVVRTVPAPPEAYTDVRWTLTAPVAPGSAVRGSGAVKVG